MNHPFSLDVDMSLLEELRRLHPGSWNATAQQYNTRMNSVFTTRQLYNRFWNLKRGVKAKRNATEGMGGIWRPPLPKKMYVIPDYKTDTVTRL